MRIESHDINWKIVAIASALGITAAAAGVIYYKYYIPVTPTVPPLTDTGKSAVDLKERGNQFFKAGNYQKAMEYYDKALELPIEDVKEQAKIHQNKAVSLENLSQREQALDEINKAIELFPKYGKALYRRSRLLEENGKYKEALLDITAVLFFDNYKTQDYFDKLSSILEKIVKVEEENIIANRKLELPSESYIVTFLESFPSDPFLTNDLRVEESGDDYQQSVNKCIEIFREKKYEECFKEVMRLLSDTSTKIPEEVRSRLLLLRGTFYFLCSHEELALKDFDEVINNNLAEPSVTVNALIKKGTTFTKLLKKEESRTAFKEALQIDPDCADIYYHRGALYENSESYDEAISDFSRAFENLPTFSLAAVHKTLNEFKRDAGRNTVSYFQQFDEVLRQFPSCLECYVIYSQVLITIGQFQTALEICQKYPKNLIQSASLRLIEAIANFSLGKAETSANILNEAIKIDPKYPYTYHTLATFKLRDGNIQRSLDLIQDAIKYAQSKQELNNFLTTRYYIWAHYVVASEYNISISDIFKYMLARPTNI